MTNTLAYYDTMKNDCNIIREQPGFQCYETFSAAQLINFLDKLVRLSMTNIYNLV
jgi:hypothetical protein